MATAKRARSARLRIHVENNPATAEVYDVTPAMIRRRMRQIPGLAERVAISYGKDRPVCTDASEACYQRNRRAHLAPAQ
jgi:hypothetical protein